MHTSFLARSLKSSKRLPMGLVSLNDILEKQPKTDVPDSERELSEELALKIEKLKPRGAEDGIIYWEIQGKDGMCALHSVNNFLQGPVYTEEDLSAIALVMDEKERSLLRPSKDHENYSDDLKTLIQGGSTNVSENGFFSYAVIEECLRVQGYRCCSLKSSGLSGTTKSPPTNVGLMCNFHEHWFTVRFVADTWYNLDSMKKNPLQLTEKEIQALFNTVVDRHYAVFIISPIIPGQALPSPEKNALNAYLNKNQFLLTTSQIHELIALNNPERPSIISHAPQSSITLFSGQGRSCVEEKITNDLPMLQGPFHDSFADDPDMLRAIQLSLKEYLKDVPSAPPEPPVDADASDVLMFRVRLPNNTKICRRFWKTDFIKCLCHWIERDPTAEFIGNRCYNLVGLFPRIELQRYNRESVMYIPNNSSESKAEEVSALELRKIFFTSQSFTLQIL